jgi:hypothetical protein
VFAILEVRRMTILVIAPEECIACLRHKFDTDLRELRFSRAPAGIVLR